MKSVVLLALLCLSPRLLAQNTEANQLARDLTFTIVMDTDGRESRYNATQRIVYKDFDLNNFTGYRVIDNRTGEIVNTNKHIQITLWVGKDTNPDLLNEWLEKLHSWAAENYPDAARIKVTPIFESKADFVKLKDQNLEVESEDETKHYDQRPSLLQQLHFGIVNNVRKQARQIALLGTFCVFAKIFSSGTYWMATLGEDPLFIAYALGVSLPQDMLWGGIPDRMQAFTNEWPKYIPGLKRLKIRPSVAAFIYGLGIGVFNAIWFRETVHKYYEKYPNQLPEGQQVESAFTSSFAGQFALSEIAPIVPGALAGTAVRTLQLRRRISRRVENLIYQLFGFEMQLRGFILAGKPDLVVPFNVTSMILKGVFAGGVYFVPPVSNRIEVLAPSLSDEARKEIFYRLGINGNDDLVVAAKLPPEINAEIQEQNAVDNEASQFILRLSPGVFADGNDVILYYNPQTKTYQLQPPVEGPKVQNSADDSTPKSVGILGRCMNFFKRQ